MAYLGQVDGVTVNQRHQHYDVARRSLRSREDLQERRSEQEGVRERQSDNITDYIEKTTDQEHIERGSSLEFSGSRSSRSRFVIENTVVFII